MQKLGWHKGKNMNVLFMLLAAAALLLALLAVSGRGGQTSLEERLESALSSIEGAGKVHVLINAGEEGSKTAWSSVLLPQDEKTIVGVLIVAQGAGDPVVVAKLAQAAGTALGIEQTQIEIMRMHR